MRRAVMRVNRASNESSASHSIHLHHFIAVMVDDLDRNLADLGFVERITLGRVERRPRGFVNLGAERTSEFFVWLVCAGKIRVAHKETFPVVVRVNEPACNVVR